MVHILRKRLTLDSIPMPKPYLKSYQFLLSTYYLIRCYRCPLKSPHCLIATYVREILLIGTTILTQMLFSLNLDKSCYHKQIIHITLVQYAFGCARITSLVLKCQFFQTPGGKKWGAISTISNSENF